MSRSHWLCDYGLWSSCKYYYCSTAGTKNKYFVFAENVTHVSEDRKCENYSDGIVLFYLYHMNLYAVCN